MKKITAFIFFVFLFQNIGLAQNEFGAVGSYWRYGFEPHNGDGFGWTMIRIEKDTVINGEPFKKYQRKHYHNPFSGPPTETSNFGLIQIKNDSIFLGNQVILDFKMVMTDSLYLQLDVDIQLAIDSIGIEQIGGFDYKKWYGNKICIDGANGTGPYEPFTILETVGQIQNDYLFWNTDNCSIGGGFNNFVCYRNGDFTYPPGQECTDLIATNTRDLLEAKSIEIFPNPAENLLNIKSLNSKVEVVQIFSLEGQELLTKKVNNKVVPMDLSTLEEGIYLLKVKTREGMIVKKFVKK